MLKVTSLHTNVYIYVVFLHICKLFSEHHFLQWYDLKCVLKADVKSKEGGTKYSQSVQRQVGSSHGDVPPKKVKRYTFCHTLGQKWGICRKRWSLKNHFFGSKRSPFLIPHPKINPGYGPGCICNSIHPFGMHLLYRMRFTSEFWYSIHKNAPLPIWHHTD